MIWFMSTTLPKCSAFAPVKSMVVICPEVLPQLCSITTNDSSWVASTIRLTIVGGERLAEGRGDQPGGRLGDDEAVGAGLFEGAVLDQEPRALFQQGVHRFGVAPVADMSSLMSINRQASENGPIMPPRIGRSSTLGRETGRPKVLAGAAGADRRHRQRLDRLQVGDDAEVTVGASLSKNLTGRRRPRPRRRDPSRECGDRGILRANARMDSDCTCPSV